MKSYVKQQIIKHALQLYIQRPGASEKDIKREKKLLEEFEEDIQEFRERNNIK